MSYLHRIEERYQRYLDIERQLHDPEVTRDQNKARDLGKEFRQLQPLARVYLEYRKIDKELREIDKILSDKAQAQDFVSMAVGEKEQLQKRFEEIEHQLKSCLIQDDPLYAKNAIVEIRAGTGGLEAGLFAGDLLRMLTRYATNCGFKTEVLSSSPNEAGGYKEVIWSVMGENAYGKFQFESGTHRVQRVPATEASGRIHTSAATVAVLPEADEVDVAIKPEDLKIDVFRSGGPGGQSVNTTDSAVRVTHLPSGLVVSCQDEKSQLKNKQKALKVLRARLFEKITSERDAEIAKKRKLMVGSGDRSEKIRTYNYPDRRVTDHRIGLTVYNLEAVLDGDLDGLVNALFEAELEKAD